MQLRRSIVVAAAAGLTLAIAAPAQANDFDLNALEHGNFHGTWDDSVNKLCARADTARTRISIVPVDGTGPSFAIASPQGGLACTGKLNIPEDERYRMRLQFNDSRRSGWSPIVATGTFYS